jgi:hypothetical protein
VAEEMIEVIDEQGNPTGIVKPKSLIHADGDIHLGAHGFVTDGRGNLLCQRRGPDCKLMANAWDPMGAAGHVPAWEGTGSRPSNRQLSILTLVMEFPEEIGFDIGQDFFEGQYATFLGVTRTDMPSGHGWQHRTLDHNWGLVLPDIKPEQCRLEPGKVMEVVWRPASEIKRDALGEQLVEGFPYTVREPDNELLIATSCDWAIGIAA